MKSVVNDFSIHVATVNGSGSQTANNVLLRSILQMGVPVSGKNLFPSNIAGLPTWFTIRVNEDGWIARHARNDVLVVMNPETAAADVAAMGPGSLIVANDAIKFPEQPADRIVYRVPMAKLIFGGGPQLAIILLPIMIYHPLQLVVGGWLAGRLLPGAADS